jgi:predicted RNA-binding protein with PIN domain
MKTLVVDGYNLIHSQPRLAVLLEESQEAAREALVTELVPLAGPDHYDLVMLVFDAAGSRQSQPSVEEHHGITVVFTRRNQSADSFIEAVAKHLALEGEVVVATNDRALRDVSTGFGARALNADSLMEGAEEAREETRREMGRMKRDSRSRLEDRIGEEVRHILDAMRYE